MTKSTRTTRAQRYNPASDEYHKEDFPFYWLAMVNGRYSRAMEKTLKKVNLDVPRWRILIILKDEGPSSISAIATHAIAKLPTVTKTVYRMKADGLVDTCVRSDDGRVTDVSITEAGLATIRNIHDTTEELFRQSFKGLTPVQLTRLNKLLETIYHNLPEH
ncbi:MarR family winged helix-turn-helix transcriptional regulator [Parathalassolituus penaei]|uniref:MarR family winged helix-turn-helix transcriptional regulator n=1 Tax=Parathalassolituus penaei TaxID=2997323 RepID=A0A9X3EGF1_9GAMM|nr:MarR family winged helix-turn-helix transcriptional regulator [Parathalassolituus penaei]MCY0966259.1 MarR family winged helix-turn-helix transcriptional regulator [Parathalassolituus penaei]